MRVLIVGGSRRERLRLALDRRRAAGDAPQLRLRSSTLPFLRPESVRPSPSEPILLRLDDFERAVPASQAGGIRLVLTQSAYLMQKWVDALGPASHIVVTADRDAVARLAPESLSARGPWSS